MSDYIPRIQVSDYEITSVDGVCVLWYIHGGKPNIFYPSKQLAELEAITMFPNELFASCAKRLRFIRVEITDYDER